MTIGVSARIDVAFALCFSNLFIIAISKHHNHTPGRDLYRLSYSTVGSNLSYCSTALILRSPLAL